MTEFPNSPQTASLDAPRTSVRISEPAEPGARRLMLASILYFPAVLLVMLLDRVVS